MNDLVLFEDEVNPVMSVLFENGLDVTALHNHFLLRPAEGLLYAHRRRRRGSCSWEGRSTRDREGLRHPQEDAEASNDVRSAADVDDVVQDVFLRMQRGVSGLRDEERFGPWVYQIARSAVAHHHRVAVRHPVAEGETPEEEVSPPDAEDDGGAERELATYVAVFVTMMPSPYREALTLTELERLTQKQAAAMLGISLSGMKSRVQRGRLLLRQALEACCRIAIDARGRVVSCEARPDGKLPDCRCRG